MNSHEVIKQSWQKRGIKKIASDLGVSTSLIYKWSQPPNDNGSGSRNPLDRILEITKITGNPNIIEWICEQAGGYFVRNPKSSREDDYEVMPATTEIVAQFAALLAEISQAA